MLAVISGIVFNSLLLLSSSVNAQIGNLGKFDSRLLHYGIQIGYTQSKFDLDYNSDPTLRQTLQGTTSYYAAGFHIAIIGDLRLGKWFNLRLLPGVTLITRDVSYSWESSYLETHRLAERSRNVESVYGDVPLELKCRAVRWGNFRPYVTVGASYGFDFASLRKNKNQTDQSIIRLVPHDLRYTMGLGFDVFLPYVKFAIDLKMVVFPLIAFFIARAIWGDSLVTRVITVHCAMPTAIIMSMIAMTYNADYKTTSSATGLMNILCIGTIPAIWLFMNAVI